MGVSVPPDQIGDVVRQFLTGLQVPNVSPDVTSVARGMPPRVPERSVGPAAPAYAQPVGGVMGALLSAGPIGERALRNLRDRPGATIAEATGVPAIGRGIVNQDFGELMRGVAQAAPLVGGAASLVGRAALPAAEAATATGLSEEQINQWRRIEDYPNAQNAAARNSREMRQAISSTRETPSAAPFTRLPFIPATSSTVSMPLASPRRK